MIPIRYAKPLSLYDRALIDLVTTRYEGVESQWVAFEREDYYELMCPSQLRRAVPYDTKPVSIEAPAVLRIPNGEGNGISN